MHAKEREEYFIRQGFQQGIQQGRKDSEDEIRRLKAEIEALRQNKPQNSIHESQHL